MKKLIVIGATTLAAIFVALGVAPSAYAYPETSCNVTVNAQTLSSGTTLKVTGSAEEVVTNSPRAMVAGTHWTADFNGVVHSGTADVYTTTFSIPKVTAKTVFLLTVKAVMPGATSTCEKSLDITALPNGTTVLPPESHLPNTGGPPLMFLIGGLVLVAVGGIAVQQGRKRRHGSHAAHAA